MLELHFNLMIITEVIIILALIAANFAANYSLKLQKDGMEKTKVIPEKPQQKARKQLSIFDEIECSKKEKRLKKSRLQTSSRRNKTIK